MEKRPSLLCPGPMDRRQWLTVGGLSLGALATGLNPNLAGLFAAQQAAAAQGRTIDDDFSVILLWANGGPSHLDLFDLKPDAPLEIRGPFKPIRTNVPGIEINERLPRLATIADKFAILRSLHHNRGEHSGGTHRLLTGYSSIAANLKDAEFPDIGSIVAKKLESQGTDVPTFIANSKSYGGGPGYLGPGYSPFMPGPDPESGTGNQGYDPVPLYLTDANRSNFALSPEGVLRLRTRYDLLETLNNVARQVDRPEQIEVFGGYQRRAVEMLAGPRTREAFDLSREDAATRARYGDTHWGKSLLTARRLVEAGTRFVQVLAGFRLKEKTGRSTSWDDHSVNCDIFQAYEERLPVFDQVVSALIEDLHQRGLNRRVLFVFCGEFGRSPVIRNQDTTKRPGRDHWPRAMSVFLAGGGLQMGQVVGATNPRGEEPVRRAMDSNCLLATLYRRFGIDEHHEFLDRNGRPFPILKTGEPIAELL
jgi:hypothetical protein